MVEQIRPMVRLMEASRVRIHVMPYRMGAHPLLQSMLTLMWFEDQPPVTYMEGYRGQAHPAPDHLRSCAERRTVADQVTRLLRATAEDYERQD
jgi:hypothetical protein